MSRRERAIQRRIATLKRRLAVAYRELEAERAAVRLANIRAEKQSRAERAEERLRLGEIAYWRCRVGGERFMDVAPELSVASYQLGQFARDAAHARYWACRDVESEAMVRAGLFPSEAALLTTIETEPDPRCVGRLIKDREFTSPYMSESAWRACVIAADFERTRREILASLTNGEVK